METDWGEAPREDIGQEALEHEHDGALTDAGPPSTSGKRVLLRRPLAAQMPMTPRSPEPSSTGKPALLAHRIRPGRTIQLKSSPARATVPEKQLHAIAQPESVAMVGARYSTAKHAKSRG